MSRSFIMQVRVSCLLFTNGHTIAHDVASDMIDAGLKSVVMVQRSRTGQYPRAISRLIILNGHQASFLSNTIRNHQIVRKPARVFKLISADRFFCHRTL